MGVSPALFNAVMPAGKADSTARMVRMCGASRAHR